MEKKTKTYECVCCKYITKIKFNYEKHMETAKHLKIATGHIDNIKETKDEYIIRLQTDLENALKANKEIREFYQNKLKKLEKPIEIEQVKENPIKIDISSRFS